MTTRQAYRQRFGRRGTIVLAGIALLLGACGGGESPDAESSLLNRGTRSEPESLDAHKARTIQAGDVLRDLGEGLAGYGPDGELRLAAAASMDISDDRLTYTFRLRPDARWSNGDAVTAADFVYSFRRLVDPATAAFYAELSFGDVVNASEIIAGDQSTSALGVEAIGELELSITLERPVPYFLSLLTNPSTFPVHRPSVEAHGDAHARPGNLVSNGAYRLVAWEVGSYIEVERNEHYHGNDQTGIDRVRHHITPQGMVEITRYRAGELDITSTVPAEVFAQMKKERPDELKVSPYLAVYFYAFNMTKEPFRSNAKLRQALSMAIDRETIAEQVTGRGELPAFGWVPEGIPGYEPRRFSYAEMSVEERHEKARQLFAEAGFGPGTSLDIELRYNTSDAHKNIALAVHSMWRDVLGLEVTLINEEFKVMLEHIRAQEITQIFLSGWTGDYIDANTFLAMMVSNDPSNATGYSNEEYDSLMKRAATQADQRVRQAYLEEAETLLLQDHPVIPVYFFVNKNLVSPRVQGWTDNVLNYHYSQYLSFR